jgi:hypothetical protein
MVKDQAIKIEQQCAEHEGNNKWTPGVYHEVSAMYGSRAGEWNTVKGRLTNKDKGVLFRFDWSELEKDELGSYNSGFNLIQDYLDQCAALDKQLMAFIQFKTFGGNAVPKYMRTNTKYADGKNYAGSGNGQYEYASDNGGSGGFVPNMHVAAVRERFEALMTAYAERFNAHPNFECLVFSEASVNKPKGAPDPWGDLTKWYNNMAQGLIFAKGKWANTQLCQWVNAPRKDMENFVPQLLDAGIGAGMTDLCFEEKSFNYRSDVSNNNDPRGNIEWCELASGKAIVMGHMSKPAYNGDVVGRGQTSGKIQGQDHVYPTYPGNAKTRQQVFDQAVNKAKCSHVIYIHNGGTQPHAGDRDPNAGSSAAAYKATSDDYSGNYAGKKFSLVTDNFIKGGNIATKTARPAGW